MILESLIGAAVTLAAAYLKKRFGARRVDSIAKGILESSDNDVTDPTVAYREAWVAANDVFIKAAAEKLRAQVEAGKVRIAASEAIAKENARGIDATVVPRDGTEEFKPGWPLK